MIHYTSIIVAPQDAAPFHGVVLEAVPLRRLGDLLHGDSWSGSCRCGSWLLEDFHRSQWFWMDFVGTFGDICEPMGFYWIFHF